MNARTGAHFLALRMQITDPHIKDRSNDSKFNAPSCNVRPVEVAKVPVETAAKGLRAFLFMGLGGAERQQK